MNPNDEWERLNAVIEAKGMSVNYFARHIGLPSAEFLYCMKNHRDCCSRNLQYTPRLQNIIDRVIKACPEINREWLETGKGCMFSE